MKDLKNYWLQRVALKQEIVKQVRNTFVSPIYKKVQKVVTKP